MEVRKVSAENGHYLAANPPVVFVFSVSILGLFDQVGGVSL